jgi:hypothetical protein
MGIVRRVLKYFVELKLPRIKLVVDNSLIFLVNVDRYGLKKLMGARDYTSGLVDG